MLNCLLMNINQSFNSEKGSKDAKFGQCLYLWVLLCYEQNRCTEQTLQHLQVIFIRRQKYTSCNKSVDILQQLQSVTTSSFQDALTLLAKIFNNQFLASCQVWK